MSADVRNNGRIRELESLTRRLGSRQSNPRSMDSSEELSRSCSGPTQPYSYNTFVPQYTVDSETLKTLLLKKLYSYELTEPASFTITPYSGEGGGGETRLTDDSGIQSPESGSPPVEEEGDTPDFFSECERELRKLFQFVERHLTGVESQLAVLAMSPSKRSRTRSSGGSVTDEDDADDEGGETTPLAGQIQAGRDLWNRLYQTLNSLWESITSSFNQLNKLVEMHDDGTTSQQGQQFLEMYSPTRAALERRINSNLDRVTTHLGDKESWPEESFQGQRSESDITLEVRKYRPGWLILLHVLLFAIVWCALIFMYYYSDRHPTWAVTVRLLRSPFLVVLFFYFYGINIKVWADNVIDYVYIFEFHPGGTPTARFAWKVAGIFCVMFTVILGSLIFLSILQRDIPVKMAATLMWLLLLVFLLNPTKTFLRRGRFAFILVVVRILIAPFHRVHFGDFWFADQLNSLVGILLDIQYYVCFMVCDSWSDPPDKSICTTSSNGIRPIVSALPALWRFMQCLRCFYDEKKIKHLVNAVKYSTTFPVIIFATLFSVQVSTTFDITTLKLDAVSWIIVFWGIFSFIHAMYTFIWDVYCDWGLFRINQRTLLRPKLLYRWKSFYCVAIVLDMILRFSWTLKLTMALAWHIDSDVIYTVLVCGEIFRRFMWNFFRVEYEQTLSL